MVGRNLIERLSLDHVVLAPSSEEVDLLDAERIRDAVAEAAPDLIIHAAGRVGGIEANRHANARFLADNMIMGLNVVRAAQDAGVPQLLNLASSCMYPKDIDGALSEDMILGGQLEPTNEGYALAKIAVTRYCQFVSQENVGLRYVTAVPCNLYGPWDSFDPVRAHMLPSAVRKVAEAARAGVASVEIWGDGSARREFMYIGDLVDFVAQALGAFDTLPQVLNVGTGQDATVQEYYEAAANIADFTGTWTYDTTKPVGMRRKLLDCTLVNNWGWHSRHSLKEGLRLTYDFYRRDHNGLPARHKLLGRA